MRLASAALALTLCACAAPGDYHVQLDDQVLTLSQGARPLACYRFVARVPDGVDAVYARSGYLHPVYTPSGKVVTGDYCASHPHQHGVFLAWTSTRFEGRAVDFWNAAKRQGTVESSELVANVVGADHAGFEAELVHVDLTAPAGRATALTETWRVRAFALADATVIDIESVQSAPVSALELLEYAYGGFAVRGPGSWEGAAGARVLTSAGHDRVAGNATRARWVALSGPVDDGGQATIAVLASPRNPRAPEPVRIHPLNPYFCFAACQAGAFTIEPGAPRRTRYLVVAMDGPANGARLEELWQAYAAQDQP